MTKNIITLPLIPFMKFMKTRLYALLIITALAATCACNEDIDIKTFRDDNLSLDYNGYDFEGVGVILADYNANTIELINIIPGIYDLTIKNAKLSPNSASAIYSNEGRTITVTGNIQGDRMDAAIDLEMKNSLTGEWTLQPYGENLSGISIEVEKEDGVINYQDKSLTIEEYEQEFSSLGSMVSMVLGDLYFKQNGFLQAYYTGDLENPEMVLSPEGAVSYYISGSTAYLFPHLNLEIPGSDLFNTKAFNIYSIIEDGIPLTLDSETDSKATLTLEYDLLSTLLPLAQPIVESIDATGNDALALAKQMISDHLDAILQCSSYRISLHIVRK